MKKNPPVQALVLDVGNVLLQIDWASSLRLIGLKEKERFLQLGEREYFHDYERGLVSSEDFQAKLQKDLGIELSQENFQRAWCACLEKEIPGVAELLTKVKVPLFTLSNTNELHYNSFKDRPLFSSFKKLLVSHELKARKPDSKIYERALNEIGLKGEEVLFIDDLEENLASAREQNIQAESCFCSSSRLAEILRSYNLI